MNRRRQPIASTSPIFDARHASSHDEPEGVRRARVSPQTDRMSASRDLISLCYPIADYPTPQSFPRAPSATDNPNPRIQVLSALQLMRTTAQNTSEARFDLATAAWQIRPVIASPFPDGFSLISGEYNENACDMPSLSQTRLNRTMIHDIAFFAFSPRLLSILKFHSC
jgi:hypothetical protein